MIKRILLWLISIYLKPATTETNTPEVDTMSEPLVDVPVADTQPAAVGIAPGAVVGNTSASGGCAGVVQQLAAPRLGVADFEKALSFVESSVAQLGEAAKDELKELAKKYL
ncbi:hypothetical protein AB6869_24835 [Rahnella rivi]|uniref:hypothetical protein n=1 Tax=Rahnella rivi TaxID=2816249 RepID=UPI0039BDE6F6